MLTRSRVRGRGGREIRVCVRATTTTTTTGVGPDDGRLLQSPARLMTRFRGRAARRCTARARPDAHRRSLFRSRVRVRVRGVGGADP